MSERVSNEEVRRISGGSATRLEELLALDLLDARRELDEARPVLEAARWISDYCRAWYESYQRQTGDPEGNPDSAPPIESVNRVIHVIREYDAARAATKKSHCRVGCRGIELISRRGWSGCRCPGNDSCDCPNHPRAAKRWEEKHAKVDSQNMG